MFKYMDKDVHALTLTLPLLTEAMAVVRRRKSAADDRDTNPLRYAQMVLTRCLNSAAASIEVSSQQAAAAVLGERSFMSSHSFWYCFPWPALADVWTRWKQLSANIGSSEEADDDSLERDDNGSLERDGDDDDSDGYVDCTNGDDIQAPTVIPSNNPASEDGQRSATLLDEISVVDGQVPTATAVEAGTAEVYKTDNGHVAVPQHTHYRYRGTALADMSLYEYSALVLIRPKTKEQEKAQPEQDSAQAKSDDPSNLLPRNFAG